jgi:hypothetical protein
LAATVGEQIASYVGDGTVVPLWTLLASERLLHPAGLDPDYGLSSKLLHDLLGAGQAIDLFNDAVAGADQDLLAPLRRKDCKAPPIRIESVPQFQRDALTLYGSDGYGIVFSQGLDVLILSLAVPMAALFVERGSDSRSVGPKEAAAVIAHQLGWLTSIAERPQGRPVFPDGRQSEVALDFYACAKRFVLLHELAHVLLHAGQARPVVGMPVGTNGDDDSGWAEEIDADNIALHLALSAAGKLRTDGRAMWAGIVLFFEAQRLLEAFSTPGRSPTHPPPLRRLASLEHDQWLMGEGPMWPFYASLQRALCDVGVDVIAKSPDYVEPDGGRRGHRFAAALRSILERERARDVPDYEQFADDAMDLLQDCPSVILSETQAELIETRERRRARTAGAETDRTEQLLVTFGGRLPRDVQQKLGVDA